MPHRLVYEVDEVVDRHPRTDRGKIIGRSTYLAMSRTIASAKAPLRVEVPIDIVGRV